MLYIERYESIDHGFYGDVGAGHALYGWGYQCP
jgi:hypothetical protein